MSNLDSIVESWRILGNHKLFDLRSTKIELQRAIQMVSLVGRSTLPRSRRDENAVLEWNSKNEMLIGRSFGDGKNFRIGFSIKDFQIHLLAADCEPISTLNLDGKSRSDTFMWLSDQIEPLFDEQVYLSPELPYEITYIPEELGKTYRAPEAAVRNEFSNYFHNIFLLLEHLAMGSSEATEILSWPRFFDLSSEFILESNQKGLPTKSIALGFITGDEQIQEPSLYVSLDPKPETVIERLPKLQGEGNWQTAGWFGTSLSLGRLAKKESKTEQATKSLEFLRDSLDLLKKL